jgi:hypothetical protein
MEMRTIDWIFETISVHCIFRREKTESAAARFRYEFSGGFFIGQIGSVVTLM